MKKSPPQVYLIRYGELFLKSDFVFRQFEKKLKANISWLLNKKGIKHYFETERGRIFLFPEKDPTQELKKVFGIVSFSPAFCLPTTKLSEIKKFCQKTFKGFVKKKETFAIRVKKVGTLPYSSLKLAEEIGKVVEGKVNLENPKKEIFIEARKNKTYIFTEIFPGLGGLPVSSSGKVISFLSGGIDSPVSSFLAMKRGCQVVFLHFHSFPLVSKKSIEKCQKIVKILSDYQPKNKLILVPFQKIQTHLKTKASAKYLIVLYRRSMLRVGQKIAKKENAKAIFTGESLAQVSSQTLANLATIEEAVKIPILRPLIGMDKQEIVDLAKKIGTYEVSILPQEDCCQLFVPKHPATQARVEIIKKIEKKLNLKNLEKEILKEKEEILIE